jgi:tetratricopeptide (TPR) repeat protein
MIRGPTSPYTPIYAALVRDNAENAQILKVGGPLEHLQADTVEILTLECTAWLKLRRYADLGREVERWTFLQQNRKDSDGKELPTNTMAPATWVPWSLRKCDEILFDHFNADFSLDFPDILAASSLQYTNSNLKKSSDVLMSIRYEQLPAGDAKWLLATDHALSNVFLRQKEYRLALASLDSMMDLLPSFVESQVSEKWKDTSNPRVVMSVLLGASQCEVLSRQGRVLLQIGALPEATCVFEYAKSEWKTTADALISAPQDVQELPVVQLATAQLLVNEGLLAFACGQNDAALDDFRKTLDYLRASNLNLTKYCREHWVGPAMVVGTFSHENLMAECTNNMAICALHACRLHDAVRLMENLVREDPTAFLTERMAFNLCTLYELGADSTVSARKKRILQLVAKRFFLHDVGPESFRVN